MGLEFEFFNGYLYVIEIVCKSIVGIKCKLNVMILYDKEVVVVV